MNKVPMSERLTWAPVMRPPMPLVYLDLNHFIYLARADAQDPSVPPGYPELLQATRSAAHDQRALFPLSAQHVSEMNAIQDPAQRNALADVMEELSGFHYILGRPTLGELEIEAGIEAIYNETPSQIPLPLTRPTFGWAFGMRGGVTIRDNTGKDVSDQARQDMGPAEYDTFMRSANYAIERGMLQGPSDEQVALLHDNPNYAPEIPREGQRSRLAYELDLSERLLKEPRWRRGRLRDVISAREFAHEWLDPLLRVNEDRANNGKLPLPLDDHDGSRRLLAGMPHNQVAISIKTRYHRDPAHRWTTNDITDIDAISVAYAYCEAVFSDKAVRAALTDSPELRALGTFTPRTPPQLTNWLRQLSRPTVPNLLVPHPLPRPSTE